MMTEKKLHAGEQDDHPAVRKTVIEFDAVSLPTRMGVRCWRRCVSASGGGFGRSDRAERRWENDAAYLMLGLLAPSKGA
jgi:hypothetical protein